MSTIYGLSTVVGKSGVAVLRISGSQSLDVLASFGVASPKPRLATVSNIYHPKTQELLDQALILYFKAPHSFTGEDVVELHLHGSIAVINDVISALQTLTYVRLAQPGEFSKRAFYAGKMDLTAAEGLAALIDAETSIQKKLALRQYSGELASLYEKWRSQLVTCLAQLEALIDFPEEDIPIALTQQITHTLQQLEIAIAAHLQKGNRGEALMRGIHMAIVGRPNVGKSSLINYLAQRDAAIVSDLAGTTRDVLELRLDIGGFPITIKDTAGMRATEDIIEAEGVRRAKLAMQDADIILMLVDAASTEHSYDYDILQEALATQANVLVLLNKIDLLGDGAVPTEFGGQPAIPISLHTDLYANAINSDLGGQDPQPDNEAELDCKSVLHLEKMLNSLTELLANTYTPAAEPILTKARYRQQLQLCVGCLQAFHTAPTIETACEELRFAASSLGAITGRVEVEEVLDIIFSSFCIGK